MRDSHREVGHLQSLHVRREHVLGRSQQHLRHRDRVDVAQLSGRTQEVGDDAQVADVDAAIVQVVGQRLAVHGRGRVVSTLAQKRWDLNNGHSATIFHE